MAKLTARFQMIDEMSDRMERMAASGDALEVGLQRAACGIGDAFTEAGSQIDGMSQTMRLSADGMDYLTSAASRFDHGAMEAVYSLQELVEMGYKSPAALAEVENATSGLNKELELMSEMSTEAVGISNGLQEAMKEAADATLLVSENDRVSAETKAELASASSEAQSALEALNAAQSEATQTQADLSAIASSGTTNLEELAAATERAVTANDNLIEAENKAVEATDRVSETAKKAGAEAQNASEGGTEAITAVSAALAAAGITKMVMGITESVYELVTAYSEAESVVVRATGATGEKLGELTDSMMKVYSTSAYGDLDETAGVVGELNTRLGSTGDTLELLTDKFVTFSDVTGTDAVSGVQDVSKIVSKWEKDAKDIPDILDKLAYAGQYSGISVNQLSNTLINSTATLRSLDFTLEGSIGMLADFELAGINTSQAMMGLRTAVNKFSEQGFDAQTALQNTIQQIATMENAAEATALAVDTFGSRAGQELAQAIRSGSISVDTFSKGLEEAKGTLDTTGKAAETLDQKWEQAGKSMSAAFTQAVEPAVNDVSSALANATNWFGDVLEKAPWLTNIIVALAAGVVTLTVGISGFILVTKVIIPLVKSMGVAFQSALGPIGWVSLAISVVTAGVLAFSDVLKGAGSETDGFTSIARHQYNQIEELNKEYEHVCSTYGATSEEASRLKYQIDELTESFEGNYKTVEEATAYYDEMLSKAEESVRAYNESMEAIDEQEIGTFALIQKLEDLVAANEKTAASEQLMRDMIAELNNEIPGLSLSYEGLTANVEGYVATMKQAAETKYRAMRQQESIEQWVKNKGMLDTAKLEQEDALEKYSDPTTNGWNDYVYWKEKYESFGYIHNEGSGPGMAQNAARRNMETALSSYNENQANITTANETVKKYENLLQNIERGWEDVGKAALESAKIESERDAVESAIGSVRTELDALCTAYNEAYVASKQSIESTIGLFNEVETACELSTTDMVNIWKDQVDFMTNYTKNIKLAQAFGLDDDLIAKLSDGTQESAGQLQGIVATIEALGGTKSALSNEAAEFVKDFNKQYGDVESAVEEFSTVAGKAQIGFDKQLEETAKKMHKTVTDDMNLSTEAETAAAKTIDSYINMIKAKTSGAVSAVQVLSDATAAVLAPNNVGMPRGFFNPNGVSVTGYADGTSYAERGYKLVGEEGPEIMWFNGGEKVLPADETSRMFAANEQRGRTSLPTMPTVSEQNQGQPSQQDSKSNKHITLELLGNGKIDVENTGKTKIVEVLTEQLKPILLRLLQSEMYEEGELSYEY